jgi:hypothetical protein
MKKIKLVGIFFALVGLGLLAGGAVAISMANAGKTSLEAVYRAQKVMMEYDENGNFIDRGTAEEGNAILSLLTDEWKYPLKKWNLDPSNPLVNTPDELMVQYARITYHVIHGTQTITLDEDVEYNGETFAAGTYEFPVDGRYWQDFNRQHPIEGPARGMAWSGTVHGLLANLAAGVASHSLVELAWFIGILILGLGGAFLVGGIGLVWAGKEEKPV